MSKRIVFWPSLVACYDDSNPDSILFSQVIRLLLDVISRLCNLLEDFVVSKVWFPFC